MEGWERAAQGTYTYGKGEWEGDKYVVDWKDGKRTLQGTLTFPDGTKYVGGWKNGKEWKITLYENNRNIFGEVCGWTERVSKKLKQQHILL